MQIKQVVIKALNSQIINTKLDGANLENIVFRRKESIRLTFPGCRVMSKYFDSYTFAHNDDFKAKHIIAITRELKYPFYLSKTVLVLFHGEDALMLKLHANDIKQFLERASIFH